MCNAYSRFYFYRYRIKHHEIIIVIRLQAERLPVLSYNYCWIENFVINFRDVKWRVKRWVKPILNEICEVNRLRARLSESSIANHVLNGLRLDLRRLALPFDSCIRKLIMFELQMLFRWFFFSLLFQRCQLCRRLR